MTTKTEDTRADHVRWPSMEDLTRALARAKQDNLKTNWGTVIPSDDGLSLIHTRGVTASGKGPGVHTNAHGDIYYLVVIREFISEGRVELSCSCPAGKWGKLCKHMALSHQDCHIPTHYELEVMLPKGGDDDGDAPDTDPPAEPVS